jgi:hypothetical protein
MFDHGPPCGCKLLEGRSIARRPRFVDGIGQRSLPSSQLDCIHAAYVSASESFSIATVCSAIRPKTANANRRLLSLYDQASRDLGLGGASAVDPGAAGASS